MMTLFRERKTDFKFITSLTKRNLAPELPKGFIITALSFSFTASVYASIIKQLIAHVSIARIQKHSFQLTYII